MYKALPEKQNETNKTSKATDIKKTKVDRSEIYFVDESKISQGLFGDFSAKAYPESISSSTTEINLSLNPHSISDSKFGKQIEPKRSHETQATPEIATSKSLETITESKYLPHNATCENMYIKSVEKRKHARSLSLTKSSFSDSSPAASFLSQFAEDDHVEISDFEFNEGDVIGKYVIGKCIGRGATSEVREILTDNKSEHLVAKIVRKEQKGSYSPLDSGFLKFEKELIIWRRLNHRNILPLINVIDTLDVKIAITICAEKGNLLNYLMENGPLEEKLIHTLFTQLVEVLSYLHEDIRVVHRDIKLDNILLGMNDKLYLADFGFSEQLSPCNCQGNETCIANMGTESVSGTINYCSPEELKCSAKKIPRYDLYKADIWSLGVVLYAITVGHLPFHDEFLPRLQYSIISAKYKPVPETVSEPLRNLIGRLLDPEPTNRPDCKELSNTPWLNQDI